jgi:hypothetical protein
MGFVISDGYFQQAKPGGNVRFGMKPIMDKYAILSQES